MAAVFTRRPRCYIYANTENRVSPVCVDATEQALKRVAGLASDQIVKITDIREFHRIPEERSIIIIIIPGGDTAPIARALMPAYDKIRNII